MPNKRKGKQKTPKEYKSYNHFLSEVYPQSKDSSRKDSEDPFEYGAELANESIPKLQKLLSNK